MQLIVCNLCLLSFLQWNYVKLDDNLVDERIYGLSIYLDMICYRLRGFVFLQISKDFEEEYFLFVYFYEDKIRQC